jgi:sulfur carrier protein
MEITVNGDKKNISGPMTVAEYMKEMLGKQPVRVAVAVNGEVVSRESWQEHTIEGGDKVEIVRPLQGG